MNRPLVFFLFALVGGAWSAGAHAQGDAALKPDPAFKCGGEVETRAWKLWDESARAAITKLYIDGSLKAQNDSYGLYDVQERTHNLLAMAARCGRDDRLLDIAKMVARTYDALVVVPGEGLGWICKGGNVCKQGSSLHNTEVSLNSSQFLAFAARVASALAERGRASNPESREFILKTAFVITQHLNRWSRDPKQLRLDERLPATPAQIRDNQSRLFFNDHDLWTMAMYAELAGILEAMPDVREALGRELEPQAREYLIGLLKLLRARVTLAPVESKRLRDGRGEAADIDRGFWRRYADNRYAAYAGKEPPVSCSKEKGAQPRVNVKPETVPLVDSGGWDISHARRVVHVVDAFDRQSAAMTRRFDLPAGTVPGKLGPAFATALVARVWNGDAAKPLFSNYWDGNNGWYRAGYSGGSGACQEGYPPFGLTDSFAYGGFATWSAHRPEISPLGRRLYAMTASTKEDDVAFLRSYYPGLAPSATGNTRILSQLQFWPSLVEAGR